MWEFLNEVLEYVDIVYIFSYLCGYIDIIYFLYLVGFQMFYCVGYEGVGGLNLFIDGFFVVEKLR